MTVFSYVLLCAGLISIFAFAVACQSVLLRLRKVPPEVSDSDLEPITILKPLKGVDSGLLENLRAILLQDHPSFEVIFGAEDADDPALILARTVALEFPHLRIKFVKGGAPQEGQNPKVRILRRMVELASHEWVLISDSNVRPAPDYLKAMQRTQIAEQADLVHTVLSGSRGESFGARLEELQLNSWVASAISFAQRFGHPCVIGKSMLLRRSYLVEERALVRMQDILAEDYIMGAELHRTGRKVALASYILPVVTGSAPFRTFLNRHIRWGQMRRRIAPLSYLMELGANPAPLLLGALCLLDGAYFVVGLAALGFKWVLDVFVYRRLSAQPQIKTIALIPLKDMLVFGIWMVSAVKRTVRWRGNVMWVGPGSRLEPVKTKTRRPAAPEMSGELLSVQ
jgi:ceramide glucosyltransferase